MIQSTEASNAIEGIKTSSKRLNEIMADKIQPEGRSEGEIAGYRDVLQSIHLSYDHIPISSNVLLQLHRDLFKFSPSQGGMWKTMENEITETYPDGTRQIRFRNLPTFETPGAMDELNSYVTDSLRIDDVDPLILTASYILDFLCIHPFNDGNGRMSRLLTLLFLYKSDYKVGQFISIEKKK